jgi:phenylalanyl-tRNA synthetase beta chain
MKQDLLSVFPSIVGTVPEVTPANTPEPWSHPGRTATVMLANEPIGTLAEIHPTVRARFGLPHRAAALLLDLSRILQEDSPVPAVHPLPAFPAVTYDETVPRSVQDSFAALQQKLLQSHPLLESVTVRDLFARSKEQFNLTLRFIYRAPDRTLTEEEVKEAHQKVMAQALLAPKS